MEHLNSFKGLRQDLSKLQPNTEYCTNILNFRPITDEGGTTGAMVNIKGNEFAVNIPCVSDVWRIDPILAILSGSSIEVEFTIDGYTNFVLNVGKPSTLEEFCRMFVLAFNSDYSLQALGFTSFYNDTYILIINTTGVTSFVISSFYYNGELIEEDIISKVSDYDCGLTLIGWKRLRDSIYLFTTSCSTENPGGVSIGLTADPESLGQIWRLDYDNTIPLSTTSPTLTLIYNSYLNFTNTHPIPELGGTVSVYENDQIQRLYWTDNFNNVRSLNVGNDNAFAYPVDNLDLKPEITYSIPELKEVIQTGGQSKVGIYQLAYRYSNFTGSNTAFFIPSDPVHVVTDSDEFTTQTADFTYDGTNDASITGKQLKWEISGLDVNYQYIEVVILYRATLTDVPEIYIGAIIPVTDTVEYIFTGQSPDNDVIISLDEFLQKNYSFEIAKSIEQKNSFLFAANTKSKVFDLEYDAKAFRFCKHTANVNNGKTYVLDNTGTNYSTIPSVADSYEIINPYNDGPASVYSWDGEDARAFKYQKNSLTLGGEGANIKYSFIEDEKLSDVDINTYRVQSGSDATTKSFTNYKSPYKVQNKGYKRNEIYRFGILFFDKSGNPGFVKWIDDIRIPGVYDKNVANESLPTQYVTYPLCVTKLQAGGTYNCYTRDIGLNFEVNIPADISRKISGFSIVRCERTEADKTIVAHGLVDPSMVRAGSGVTGIAPGGYNNYGVDVNDSFIPHVVFFNSPDFVYKEGTVVSTNDKIVPQVAARRTGPFGYNLGASNVVEFKNGKYYEHSNVPTERWTGGPFVDLTIDDYIKLPAADINNNTATFPNHPTQAVKNWFTDGSNLQGRGGKTLALYTLTSATTASGYGIPTAGGGFFDDKWIADYTRTNSNKYGGSTYYAKTLNKYITCGQFQPVTDSTTDIVYNVDVWGGDSVVTLWDYTRLFGWTYNGNNGKIDTEDKHVVYTIPVESSINTLLKSGDYYNKFGINDASGTSPGDYYTANYKEDYIYNPRYSNENNIVKYFHKPFNYLENKTYDIFDNRVWASQQKISGEAIDNWTIFKSADYLDVDGTFGPINNIIRSRDKLHFFQDDGIGIISSNDRVIVNDTNNINVGLALGTGSVLQRFDYISTSIGCKHQFGMCATDSSLYWFDVKTNKLYRLSDNITPISDLGMTAFFNYNINNHIKNSDNPYIKKGITATYNQKFNEVLFTFLDYYDGIIRNIDKSFTIAYSEYSHEFTGFYSFTPSVYINDRKNVFSPESSNTILYLHDVGEYCTFYDNTYPSKLSFIINPYPTETKIFNNLEITSEAVDNQIDYYGNIKTYTGFNEDNITTPNIIDNTFDSVRFYNDYQNTDYQLFSTIGKRKERTWNLAIPRNRVIYNTANDNIFSSTNLSTGNKSFGERMRDKYIIADLIYNNIYNYKFTVNTVKTLYEKSFR